MGENGDLSVDGSICDDVQDLVGLFWRLTNAKGSFSTKFVNRDLLSYDPQSKTRVHFPPTPEEIAPSCGVRYAF
jgi:spore photoproduct lyase